MTRSALAAALVAAAVAGGCGDDPKPTPPATDPESIKKLEELQRKGREGEK